MIKAIFACDEKWGIGKKGGLPWSKNSEDLKWFKECTDRQAVVMGRRTWESLPVKPLPNRLNFVITSTSMENCNPRPHGSYNGSDVKKIVKDVIEARTMGIDDVWIIGGASLFKGTIKVIDELWISRIKGDFDCDTFLDKDGIAKHFELFSSGSKNGLWIEKYKRK
jgi:dihydrofolate reductase